MQIKREIFFIAALRKNAVISLLYKHTENTVATFNDVNYLIPLSGFELGLNFLLLLENEMDYVRSIHWQGKVVPLRPIEAHLGDRRYSSYSFLTSALQGG
jgi:hypothetical protein